MTERLLPSVRDSEGRELSQAEIMDWLLTTGQATTIPPAYGDEHAPCPISFRERARELGMSASRRRLMALLDDLTPAEQDLLWARKAHQQTFEEIGESLGISRQAAQRRYERLIARLNRAEESAPLMDEEDRDDDWYDDSVDYDVWSGGYAA